MSLSTCCLPTKLNSQKNGFILVQVCIILDAQFNEEKNGRRISHFPLSLKVLTFRTLIFRILVGLKTKVSTVLFSRNPKKNEINWILALISKRTLCSRQYVIYLLIETFPMFVTFLMRLFFIIFPSCWKCLKNAIFLFRKEFYLFFWKSL